MTIGRRRVMPLAAVAAVLAGILALAGLLGSGTGAGGAGRSAGNGAAGPEIFLQGVDFREIKPDGAQYSLVSERASYLLAARTLAADQVTLRMREKSVEIVVRAPRALWDMGIEQILLPEGAEAESPSGWIGAAGAARLSLRDRLLTSQGRATLTGPGISVAGENLVWRWREGTMGLTSPRTRFEPGRIRPGKV